MELLTMEDAVFKIPLKDGSLFDLPNDLLAMYKIAYPKVDVNEQIRLLVIWNVSNEKKRKTKGGILRHINGWLSKSPPSQLAPATTTQKEYAASTTMAERVSDLSWADGL